MAQLGSSNVYGDLNVSRELRAKEAKIDDKSVRKSHTNESGDTTVSTSSPSGGSNGDLWLQV